MRGLQDDLARIGAKNVVISTNQPVRKDGYPCAQERVIRDTGVAVSFTRDNRALVMLVMEQDRFNTVIGNTPSLAMASEGPSR